MSVRFRAPSWLKNPHLQTIAASFPLRLEPRKIGQKPEPLAIPIPGGALVGEVTFATDLSGSKARRPLVVVIHGVGGTSRSLYVARAASVFAEAGFHVLRLNMRGAGMSIHDAPSLYHAALIEDVAAVARTMHTDPHVDGIAYVGFSLGGNLALCFAADYPNDLPAPLAIVAISAPLDLDVVSRCLESRGTFVYRRHVVEALVAQAKTFQADEPTRVPWTPKDLGKIRTIRDYDELVIAPMHGFRSAADYYAKASSGPRIARIAVPTLLVHAEDDPMVPGRTVRPFLAGRGESVAVAWSDQGGHVAFIEAAAPGRPNGWTHNWAVRRALEFVNARRSI